MRRTGSTQLRIVGLTLLILLLTVAGNMLTTTASLDASVFTVDIKRPDSADHNGSKNYRTLAALFAPKANPKPDEHDTVLVAPGIYPGSFTIATKGLVLRAIAGPEKTIIRGQVTLKAPDIMLDGLTIDAAGTDVALRLEVAPGTHLQHLQLTGAKLTGLQARESVFFTVSASRISGNPGQGISVSKESQGAQFENLQVQGNGGMGIAIEESSGVQISASTISLNGMVGIRAISSQGTEIRQSSITANAGPGIQLVASGGSHIEENEILGNAGFGILLQDASDNEILANILHDNDRAHGSAGGIGIEGSLQGSHGNCLEKNQIDGQTEPEAAGIALLGQVTDSEIKENQISHNYRGITLTTLGGAGPAANQLIGNEITASKADGILLDGSGGANLIQDNEIAQSLQAGLRLESSPRERFRANRIHDNGAEGVFLSDSAGITLWGDQIIHNGRAGVRIEKNSNEIWIADSFIEQNDGDGLTVKAVSSMRAQSSSFRINRGAGIRAQNIGRLRIQNNDIRGNGDVGIFLANSVGLDIIANLIADNRQGGLSITRSSKEIDLSENAFGANAYFGLEAEPSVTQLTAQRNWWGAAEGPRGVPLGGPASADKVNGVPFVALFPWLPAPPDQIIVRSVRGRSFDHIEGGETLDARDVAGAEVQLLSDVRGGPSLLLLGRPSQTPAQAVGLPKPLAFAYVQIAGVSAGRAQITFGYNPLTLPVQSSSAFLQLFRLTSNGQWQALPTAIDPSDQLVGAPAPVNDLRNALIALVLEATNQLSAQPPMPQKPAPPQTTASQLPSSALAQPAPPKALIALQAGETVLLPSGEYVQDIQLDRPNATLGSRDPAHPAIIHGQITISAANVMIENLRIESSNGVGLEVRAADAHILKSEIRGAHIGIQLTEGAGNVEISGNRIEANELGLSLEQVDGAVIELNQIAQNSTGGLFAESSRRITVERNDFIDNGSFNVKVVDSTSDVQADLNWWGDPRGPQGATIGLSSEKILPWLTMPSAQNQEVMRLDFTPHPAGERFAQFLIALFRLDLTQAWTALHDWTSGSDTLIWRAAPGVRLRFEGLHIPGRALLEEAHESESGEAVFDLVLIGLDPEKITLMLNQATSRMHAFRFDDQAQRWLALPGESWTFTPRSAQSGVPQAWRWILP